MQDFNTSKETHEKILVLKQQLKMLERSDTFIVPKSSKKKNGSPDLEALIRSLEGIDQDVTDLSVILGTAIDHGTELENELSQKHKEASDNWNKYEFIVNTSRDWMCLVNEDHCFEIVNLAMSGSKKGESESWEGVHCKSFFGEELYNEKLQYWLDGIVKGKEVQQEFYVNIPGIGNKYLELKGSLYKPDLSHSQSVLFIRDITARKQAQGIIKEQELFLDKVNDAIFLIDAKGKIRYWNKSCEVMFGWSKTEAIGKVAIDLLCKQEARQKFELGLKQIEKRNEWHGDLHFKTKKGDYIISDSRWVVMPATESEDGGTLLLNTNITEKKNLELQFYRAQRVESIGVLASGIAHDLNNVLSLFFLAIRALKPKLSDKQGKTILNLLENSAQRGVNLVRQILTFARGMDGEQMEVNVSEVVEELNDFIKETFPKNIAIRVKKPQETLRIYGSPTQLHQVFLNICVNAKDAMPDGGDLTIELSKEELGGDVLDSFIFHENTVPGQYIRINFSDTGTGIPHDLLLKIFNPFFTTKEIGKGTGLGLSTVRSIIKNHRGIIDIKSQLNVGTQFKIFLPVLDIT